MPKTWPMAFKADSALVSRIEEYCNETARENMSDGIRYILKVGLLVIEHDLDRPLMRSITDQKK